MRYPADPPPVDEIVAVMRHTASDRHGWRIRAMIVVLWRAGLRVQEALALAEHDLDSGADVAGERLRKSGSADRVLPLPPVAKRVSFQRRVIALRLVLSGRLCGVAPSHL